jgi:NAD(P)-dependent dehydrogenase (short-subunit alcohol dehydrogenase family)
MQRFAARAIERGEAAAIVNVLSMVIRCGQSFLAPYTASKAALAALTRNPAQAHRRDRIRINGIACGWMDTPGEDATQRRWHGAGDDWLEKAEAAQPFGQLVKPAEVAGLVAYLLAGEAGVMTGAVIDFDQNVAGAYPEQ